MSVAQINRALKYNGDRELYPRDLRDYYLQLCIEQGYDYEKVEEELESQGLEPLNKNWGNRLESKYQQYDDLESYARKNRKGLWNKNNPTPPWDYRKAEREKGKN